MKTLQQIIAVLCIFAAGIILTAAICGATTICQAVPQLSKVVPEICNYEIYKAPKKMDKGINVAVGVKKYKGQNFIVFSSDVFTKLNDQEFVCVLLHEAGHIALKHKIRKTRAQNHKDEFEADRFMKDKSVQRMGMKPDACTNMLITLYINGLEMGIDHSVASNTHPSITDRVERLRRN